MKYACLYFQVHQPVRLRRFSIFGNHNGALEEEYFDEKANVAVFRKIANKCYLPANKVMLGNIRKFGGEFRIAYSITGIFLEQCEKYGHDVLASFQELAATGNVEFLAETYYHSLSSLFRNKREFREQVRMHAEKIWELFGQRPSFFRNTEALFSNEIAGMAEDMGHTGIITEGTNKLLGPRSPNHVYSASGRPVIRVLLRNFPLSDDVAYRFSDRRWAGYPLTAAKFANSVAGEQGECVNLFMDYETFGEHQWADTGIFDFLREMPGEILGRGIGFRTPSELVRQLEPVGEVGSEGPVSWADTERDASAWLSNEMQYDCFDMLQGLEERAKAAGKERIWRILQNSDNLYYLCTKFSIDEEVHNYFSPYRSPYDAYINYKNILEDFAKKV
ncbi:MAG: glycoside hydrolase family 57 protein [Candidatus Micrarchaeota archaeon]|nr:glycoside hydrolase family 57 protein [Candidatus Micrarchaeota archaeon]